jgi:hypothetical protein
MIPELRKKPGIAYAFTEDGVELPVIDITHPAFAIELSAAQVSELQAAFRAEIALRSRMPAVLRRFLIRRYLAGSIIGRGLLKASGGFLSGMSTYLMKLGPENLGTGYANPVDRRLAGSFPAAMLRIRLQDTARLLFEAFAGPLRGRPGAGLHILSIGGGHAAEVLNALILSQAADPGLLGGRAVRIHVLDLEAEAPAFGKRSLEALRGEKGPLSGLDATLDFVRYNWSEPAPLFALAGAMRARGAVVAIASEGALFEYGSDADILSNLRALHQSAPEGTLIVGSVTRNDKLTNGVHLENRIPVRPRGLRAFGALAAGAGWRVESAVERAFSDTVRLARA